MIALPVAAGPAARVLEGNNLQLARTKSGYITSSQIDRESCYPQILQLQDDWIEADMAKQSLLR
ncbi:hypothetical protein Vi05172_g11643 [Venturia inaequalis]|nr:hypothetical protein Vi05172_g11643 [Venturia inaequalis]